MENSILNISDSYYIIFFTFICLVDSNPIQYLTLLINSERWLSSGKMLCERLLCPNVGLNALGRPTQDPH